MTGEISFPLLGFAMLNYFNLFCLFSLNFFLNGVYSGHQVGTTNKPDKQQPVNNPAQKMEIEMKNFYATITLGRDNTNYYMTLDAARNALSADGFYCLHPADGHTYSCDIWVRDESEGEFASFLGLPGMTEVKIVELTFSA